MNDNLKEIVEWLCCILIAAVLATAIRYFIGTPTVVQQPSMTPTLMQDERLLLNKITMHLGNMPQRGDIVTFEAPSKSFVTADEVDLENPSAFYENDPEGVFAKFKYYVLEMGKTSYIKRVIGLPGERVQIKDNHVYINDELLDEPYLKSDVVTTSLNGVYTDIIVPEGTVFVLGDNRKGSTDSRRFGCIPKERLESKVICRFWPVNKMGKI